MLDKRHPEGRETVHPTRPLLWRSQSSCNQWCDFSAFSQAFKRGCWANSLWVRCNMWRKRSEEKVSRGHSTGKEKSSWMSEQELNWMFLCSSWRNQQFGEIAENLFLFMPNAVGARHRDGWIAGHQRQEYQPRDSSKAAISVAHLTPAHTVKESCHHAHAHTF